MIAIALKILVMVHGWSTSLPSWSLNTSWQQHFPILATPQNNMWSFITPNLCGSSFYWTNHWATNGLTLGFHFRTSAPSYFFQHALWHDIWSPSCSNFMIFWPWGGHLDYSLINFPNLLIIFPILFHNVFTMSFNYRYLSMRAHIPPTLWVSTYYIPFMAIIAREPMM
jgi:hypothetical protein